MDDDTDPVDPAKELGSDDAILTPKDDYVKNGLVKMTDVPLPRSSSFQERKALFIEQARRLVINI